MLNANYNVLFIGLDEQPIMLLGFVVLILIGFLNTNNPIFLIFIFLSFEIKNNEKDFLILNGKSRLKIFIYLFVSMKTIRFFVSYLNLF